ncbi:MAG: polymer-forming cytoskeletal protein [Patescibacteria group bacterium]
MLGKDNNSSNQELETIIGPSVNVKGNFTSQGNLKIEGSLNGTIDTMGDVRIGTDAKIKANINAREIHISGTVDGIIKATEKITLTSTAKVTGDIETKNLAIEDGAFFSGKCIMGNGSMKTIDKSFSKDNKKSTDVEDNE